MYIKKLLKSLVASMICLSCCLSALTAFASVLGTAKINGYTKQIGEGTFFTHNLFYSDQKGVGPQSENYVTYTPNASVIPTLTYGEKIFGAELLSDSTSKLESKGTDVLAGSNADFFSLQTGVPMSNAIIDGKIITKDASGQDCIGIMEDGTAFISYVFFHSYLVKEDGSKVTIHNINKYRQPYSVYLMSDEFSDKTRNTTKGFDVVLGSIEGEMRLGSHLTAVVESVTETASSAPIPKGKLVLTVDAKASAELVDPIKSLTEGEKISIHFGAEGDPRWNEVKTGMGSVGSRLLTNGEVNPNLATGAAPRTAIGITKDGKIILYTIDGRQSGHSYGVQLKTLANRMKELGCTDALNLDGGGSTVITAQLPGNHYSTIKNKPSDGKERKVSTFFYFINTEKKTGEFAHLHLYPDMNYVLKGAELQLSVLATDTAFYPVEVPEDTVFSVQEGKSSHITEDGLFTAKENGLITVYATSGDIKGSIGITCLETPTDLIVKNKKTGKQITSLALDPEETVPMTADAFGGYNQLTETDDLFTWKADPGIGSFDENHIFTASDEYGASGNIYVSAGNKTVTIPVSLAKASSDDPAAYPIIDMTFDEGILNGTVSCEYNIATEADGISLRADGKEAEFTYDSETGNFVAELDSETQKITVYATNSFGFTSFSTITVDGNETETPFVDTVDHWAEDVINYMYSQGIINGDPTDGALKFYPQKQMTRSEFAVMTVRYLGLNADDFEDTALPYSDIEDIPQWALNSFKALYAADILKGRYVSETESCADPLSSISRAEVATIVARTLPDGFFETEIVATDSEAVANWAEHGFSVMMNIGAMRGYEDGSLLPSNPVTKAEAAKILYSTM